MHEKRTETFGKGDQRIIAYFLSAKHRDFMFKPDALYLIEPGIRQVTREIHSGDFHREALAAQYCFHDCLCLTLWDHVLGINLTRAPSAATGGFDPQCFTLLEAARGRL